MKKKKKNILIYVILISVSIIMIFPLIWMFLLALKSFPEQYSSFFELINSKTTISNFTDTLGSDSFDLYLINSVLVAGAITLGNILFCSMVGYAIARKHFFGKNILTASILGVLIIPTHIIMIPLYRLMVEFSWINSFYALIVPWLVTPFGIFLIWQYLKSVPPEIEEAARIDGASFWTIFFRIILPVSKPVLIVLAIYTFLGNWNSFLFPFLFTNDSDFRTLPVGLAFYLGKQSIDWGHLMAGASISALPIIILFLIFQKQIIKGLIAGSLKD
jgi:multiple sugar transport system permease protein